MPMPQATCMYTVTQPALTHTWWCQTLRTSWHAGPSPGSQDEPTACSPARHTLHTGSPRLSSRLQAGGRTESSTRLRWPLQKPGRDILQKTKGNDLAWTPSSVHVMAHQKEPNKVRTVSRKMNVLSQDSNPLTSSWTICRLAWESVSFRREHKQEDELIYFHGFSLLISDLLLYKGNGRNPFIVDTKCISEFVWTPYDYPTSSMYCVTFICCLDRYNHQARIVKTMTTMGTT